MRPSSVDPGTEQSMDDQAVVFRSMTDTPRGAGDSRRRRRRDYGPAHGHVIAHPIGGPPPRPRDPDRPVGRIGPYAS